LEKKGAWMLFDRTPIMHVFPGTWVFVLDKSKIDGKQRGEIKK